MPADSQRQNPAIQAPVGVAVYPDHGGDMAGLIRAADEAMYRAKHSGGDRVQVATALDEEGLTTAARQPTETVGQIARSPQLTTPADTVAAAAQRM
jgi:predicted signal transduction protein with EAL and GGDEF domain